MCAKQQNVTQVCCQWEGKHFDICLTLHYCQVNGEGCFWRDFCHHGDTAIPSKEPPKLSLCEISRKPTLWPAIFPQSWKVIQIYYCLLPFPHLPKSALPGRRLLETMFKKRGGGDQLVWFPPFVVLILRGPGGGGQGNSEKGVWTYNLELSKSWATSLLISHTKKNTLWLQIFLNCLKLLNVSSLTQM